MRNIRWTDRYSGTDKPDDLGRWARVGYLSHKSNDAMKQIQIAWINKLKGKYITYVYIGSGQFSNNFDNINEAKEYCQQAVNDFWINYLA